MAKWLLEVSWPGGSERRTYKSTRAAVKGWHHHGGQRRITLLDPTGHRDFTAEFTALSWRWYSPLARRPDGEVMPVDPEMDTAYIHHMTVCISDPEVVTALLGKDKRNRHRCPWMEYAEEFDKMFTEDLKANTEVIEKVV